MSATNSVHDAIARRAYFLWEAAGRPPGDGVDFWLQAERELRAAAPADKTAASDGVGSAPKREPSFASNIDRTPPVFSSPATRRPARQPETPRRSVAAPADVKPRASTDESERFIVALDSAHLRIYRADRPAPQRSVHFELVVALDVPMGKESYSSRDTDQAGRFPGSKGSRAGSSIDERLPMQEERDRRVAVELATHVGKFLQQHPRATWDFAAGPALHNAVLTKIPATMRDRLGQSIEKDLVNQPLETLRQHFPRAGD
jgi:hypothetical protein